MKSIRLLGMSVLVVILAASAGWAQAGGAGMAPGTAGAKSAPAAAGEAQGPPKPNPALDQLKYFVGSWECTGMGYVPNAHPTTARVKMDWDLNGFFINLRYEERKTDANPLPLTAVEHWGYSENQKKLVAGQIDSFGDFGTQATAGWEGDRLVWMGEMNRMGAKVPTRDTFVKKGENEVTHLGESQDKGVWTKEDEESCRRVLDK